MVRSEKGSNGAIAIADSMDTLADAVKCTHMTITVRYGNPNAPSIGECVAKLVAIPGLSPDDQLNSFGLAMMDNPDHREVLMALPTTESILGWLRAKKQMGGGSMSGLAFSFLASTGAIADSMDTLADTVKCTHMTINVTYGNPNAPSIGECVAKLVAIPGLSPDDQLISFGLAMMDNPDHREVLMALPTTESILGWLRAKKQMGGGSMSGWAFSFLAKVGI